MGLIVGCGTLPVRLDAMDRPGYSISLAGLSREDWAALRALINRSSISRGLGGYVGATAKFTCSSFTLNSTLSKPHFLSDLVSPEFGCVSVLYLSSCSENIEPRILV